MGQADEALVTLLREAARLDPADTALHEHLARVFVARGDRASAAEYLTIETAGTNPQLRLMVAEMRLRSGRVDEGMDNRAATARTRIPSAGRTSPWSAGRSPSKPRKPDSGVVELAADVAVAQEDWPSAAAALQESS